MRGRRQLSSRILTSVVAILLASTLVGFALVTLSQRAKLQHEYQQRALAVAQTFAQMPSIREALARRRPTDRRLIQSLAEQVRHRTDTRYIVVIDRHGVRYSHPDSRLIGHRVAEPLVALDGHPHTGLDYGNLGTSANAKVPLRAPDGSIIGEVSAGILEQQVSAQLLHEVPSLLLYFACALAIGVVASLTLARRLKRSTFGLELEEIAALVQEREAMLHGISEGVVTLDRDGRVTLINDEARRLIPLDGDAVGQPVHELVSHRRLCDLLTGTVDGQNDPVVVTDDHILVINRMPVVRQGRDLGAVVTLRDRTELEGLLRELDSVDALTDALRAQQHEFSNRMHTVAGLIELGDQPAAARYALEVSGHTAGLAEAIRERVEAPEIAALLLAKTTVAGERGVELALSEDSRLVQTSADTNMLLTIIGNLIDNAIDAVISGPPPARVDIRLRGGEAEIVIEVTDSGRGVPAELASRIFTDGFTTKAADEQRHRGIGLALVHRLVTRAGGAISVDCSGATTFRVVLPTAGQTDTCDPPGPATPRGERAVEPRASR